MPKIVQWHVAPGDHVVADQPLVSVETDKAVVDIPAPRGGHIATLGAAEGDRIAVGARAGDLPAPRRTRMRAPWWASCRARHLRPPRDRSRTGSPCSTCAHRRRRAAWRTELRCELESITGSGPDGVISVADVQRAAGNGRPVRRSRLGEPARRPPVRWPSA